MINIPLYIYTHTYVCDTFFIHSSAHGYLGCFHVLGIVKKCWNEQWSVYKPSWGNTDSMDMGLSKLREIMKDREAWRAAVHGFTKTQRQLSGWTTAAINTVYAFNLPLLIFCPLCFLFYFMSFIKIIKACSIKSQIMLSHKEKSYLNHHHKFFILEAISFNNCKVLFLLYSSIFLYKFHLSDTFNLFVYFQCFRLYMTHCIYCICCKPIYTPFTLRNISL